MNRLKIAVLFGGCSEEHPISVKSAQEVAKNLDTEKYEPHYIGITKDGAWKLCERPCADWENGGGAAGGGLRPVILSPDRSTSGLLVLEGGAYSHVHVDMVLPVLHGRLGEDGAVQGLLELSGIPYAGCDVYGSALCMDKSLAYIVARNAGIATPDFVTLADGGIEGAGAATGEADLERLCYPVFVKPARSGSSFGVTKVRRKEELPYAVENARKYDTKVLVEAAVSGCEVGCSILGDGADLFAGEIDQISLSHGFFRIHQEHSPESGSDNSTVTVPADITAAARILVQETAKTVYRALGLRGLARVDMFLTESGGVVLNEVNTMPGLTSYSRYPRMMVAAGLSFAEVLSRLISMTLKGRR
jgi:D-alanine--(R)-lactate ligase